VRRTGIRAHQQGPALRAVAVTPGARLRTLTLAQTRSRRRAAGAPRSCEDVLSRTVVRWALAARPRISARARPRCPGSGGGSRALGTGRDRADEAATAAQGQPHHGSPGRPVRCYSRWFLLRSLADRPSRSQQERTGRRDRRHFKVLRASGQPPLELESREVSYGTGFEWTTAPFSAVKGQASCFSWTGLSSARTSTCAVWPDW